MFAKKSSDGAPSELFVVDDQRANGHSRTLDGERGIGRDPQRNHDFSTHSRWSLVAKLEERVAGAVLLLQPLDRTGDAKPSPSPSLSLCTRSRRGVAVERTDGIGHAEREAVALAPRADGHDVARSMLLDTVANGVFDEWLQEQ